MNDNFVFAIYSIFYMHTCNTHAPTGLALSLAADIVEPDGILDYNKFILVASRV